MGDNKEEQESLIQGPVTSEPKSDDFLRRGLNYIGKTAQNATNYLSRTTRKVFGQFSVEDMKKIKDDFLSQTLKARENQKINEQFGTMPTVVLPMQHIIGVAGSIKDTNGMFTFLQFNDTVMKGVSASAAVTVGVSVAAGSAIVMPPLLCIPLVVCLAAFLQFQKTKNKELLYASELIFSMCQDMLPDLIRMYNFYTKVNTGKDTKNQINNPFIAKTMKKITDLQVYIISLCEPIVVQFLALSFGIIDNFDERYDRGFGDDKLKKIFGEQGFSDRCHLLEDERVPMKGSDGAEMKKSDDDCDGDSSERSFASVKRAIIARLTRLHVTRQATNFFASSEKYRQAIRDITIVGILFSQASARFSLDAIDHVSALQDANTEFTDSVNSKQTKIFVDIADTQSYLLKYKIEKINNSETAFVDPLTSRSDGSTGGRRRKRTRKYRR